MELRDPTKHSINKYKISSQFVGAYLDIIMLGSFAIIRKMQFRKPSFSY